jgi:hypothetical protein
MPWRDGQDRIRQDASASDGSRIIQADRDVNIGRFLGGIYTAISPPEYDTGGARVAARVAGGGLALGSAIGLAGSIAAASDVTWATIALGGVISVPGVGEVAAAAAGLYLVGDWAYHNTHAISHTFDSARDTAAHVADDLTSWL